jgi:hypothetical protein
LRVWEATRHTHRLTIGLRKHVPARAGFQQPVGVCCTVQGKSARDVADNSRASSCQGQALGNENGEFVELVLSNNSTEFENAAHDTCGLLSKGRASFGLVADILCVNSKVLTARFNGRTVESLILRNSLISKSDSFLTTHKQFWQLIVTM